MVSAPLPDESPPVRVPIGLDTMPDPRVDSLVGLAADIHGVPIAAVTLLENGRQWIKSVHGITVEKPVPAPAFSPAIPDASGVLVVEDASLDERFSQNPLVTGEPHIRFYAGATIRGSAGEKLGTLHLAGREPRTLDAAGRQRLAALALGIAGLVELHTTVANLQQVAVTDPLTGLNNRRMFDEMLERAYAAASAERPLALLLIDLDRFKAVNGRHGFAVGDRVIALTASRLLAAVRPEDKVARLGADEFAVLAPDLRDDSEAVTLAKAIAAALSDTAVQLEDSATPLLTASIGLAICPRDAEDRGSLMRAAGAALYRAKRAGGGCIVRPRAAALRTGKGRTSVGRELEQDLLTALGANQTQLWWQPYISLETDDIVGLEALLRWHRPGYGDVPPATLLPLVEANGLTVPLDEWVLHRACHMAAAWPEPRTASVNLSAHWFGQDDVETLVSRALDASGLDPVRLCLELTEHTLIANREVAQDRMRRLHGLGARVALDDFGTGSSSLAYLQHFHFDTIKMDRAFVAPLGQDSRAEMVARTVLRMGHDLGATICAEGVETDAQLAFLRSEDCDLVQGFLLGRPAPAAMMARPAH